MNRVFVINGPNLNMLGLREPDIYGDVRYDELCQYCQGWGEYLGLSVEMYQSNHEGAILDVIQQASLSRQGREPLSTLVDDVDTSSDSRFPTERSDSLTPAPLDEPLAQNSESTLATQQVQAIIINAGGLSHTSICLRDSLVTFDGIVIDVHISNIHAREPFRHHDFLAPVSRGSIVGLGIDGYRLALIHVKALIGDNMVQNSSQSTHTDTT